MLYENNIILNVCYAILCKIGLILRTRLSYKLPEINSS